MGLSRQSEPGKSSWVLMRMSAIPFIRLGFFLIALKQGPQGEQLQVPLLQQLQPGGIGLLGAKQLDLGCIRTDGQGILPVTGPWHGGRKICPQTA